jgi:hypothetical protein
MIFTVTGCFFANGDYPGLEGSFATFIQLFRLSVGDTQIPEYPAWSALKEKPEHENVGQFMITYIWIVFMFEQFVLQITMLNFLIAIVSQSYDNVLNLGQQLYFESKCYFI